MGLGNLRLGEAISAHAELIRQQAAARFTDPRNMPLQINTSVGPFDLDQLYAWLQAHGLAVSRTLALSYKGPDGLPTLRAGFHWSIRNPAELIRFAAIQDNVNAEGFCAGWTGSPELGMSGSGYPDLNQAKMQTSSLERWGIVLDPLKNLPVAYVPDESPFSDDPAPPDVVIIGGTPVVIPDSNPATAIAPGTVARLDDPAPLSELPGYSAPGDNLPFSGDPVPVGSPVPADVGVGGVRFTLSAGAVAHVNGRRYRCTAGAPTQSVVIGQGREYVCSVGSWVEEPRAEPAPETSAPGTMITEGGFVWTCQAPNWPMPGDSEGGRPAGMTADLFHGGKVYICQGGWAQGPPVAADAGDPAPPPAKKKGALALALSALGLLSWTR